MAGEPPVVNAAHSVDEDPEELLGEVIPDPWDDGTQIDWPNNPDESDTPDDAEEVTD
jgi:hypothetical protein